MSWFLDWLTGRSDGTQPLPAVKPLLPTVTVNALQLAEALHHVENKGSMRLYGTASCPHQEKANKVFEYVDKK